MARLSLVSLLLLSLLSLSAARVLPEHDNLLPKPDTEKPESEPETASLPELPNPESEEKPEIAETVQYVVVPIHRFNVHDSENLQDIGFSLRLPIRHGHHHHHRFGGFGHRFGHKFGHRFRHGFERSFPGRENDMKVYGISLKGEDSKTEMPEMPMPMQMKDRMEDHEMFANLEKTEMPMEDKEKMEKVRKMMKKMRKCNHHHRMENGMHMHHEHIPDQKEEQPREEKEEGGFIKQFWNFFNGY